MGVLAAVEWLSNRLLGECGVGCVVVHTRDEMTDGSKELIGHAWEEMITLVAQTRGLESQFARRGEETLSAPDVIAVDRQAKLLVQHARLSILCRLYPVTTRVSWKTDMKWDKSCLTLGLLCSPEFCSLHSYR